MKKWQVTSWILVVLTGAMAALVAYLFLQNRQQQATIRQQEAALVKETEALIAAQEAAADTLSENPKLNHLTLTALEAQVTSGQDIIIYFERTGCSDCSRFNPTFNQYLTDNQLPEIYSVELQALRDQASPEEWQAFKDKYGFTQTPAFVRYKDGAKVSIVEEADDQPLTVDLVDAWLKSQN